MGFWRGIVVTVVDVDLRLVVARTLRKSRPMWFVRGLNCRFLYVGKLCRASLSDLGLCQCFFSPSVFHFPPQKKSVRTWWTVYKLEWPQRSATKPGSQFFNCVREATTNKTCQSPTQQKRWLKKKNAKSISQATCVPSQPAPRNVRHLSENTPPNVSY